METKLIWKKERNGVIYWLNYLPSNKKFVICAQNEQVLKNEAWFIQEIGTFKTEEDANKFFGDIKLKNKQ